jgi:hypothetical protein
MESEIDEVSMRKLIDNQPRDHCPRILDVDTLIPSL